MFTRFFFVSLYHTQVMKDQELLTLKPCDQEPYFYISFHSQEAIKYFNNLNLKFGKF